MSVHLPDVAIRRIREEAARLRRAVDLRRAAGERVIAVTRAAFDLAAYRAALDAMREAESGVALEALGLLAVVETWVLEEADADAELGGAA